MKNVQPKTTTRPIEYSSITLKFDDQEKDDLFTDLQM
jgi:hypothetical protein